MFYCFEGFNPKNLTVFKTTFIKDIAEIEVFPCFVQVGEVGSEYDVDTIVQNSINCALVQYDVNGEFFVDDKGAITKQREGTLDGLSFLNLMYFTGQVKESVLGLVPSFCLSNSKEKSGCLFLDRDGVLNHDGEYLYEYEKMEFFDEISPKLKAVKEAGLKIIVVTNQSGVARNYYSKEEVQVLHKKMYEHFSKQGVEIDGWYLAPTHPTKGVGDYLGDSLLRKPFPGMIAKACFDHNIDLSKSFMIGDKKSDKLLVPNLETLHIQRQYSLEGVEPELVFQDYDMLFSYLMKKIK